MRKYSSTLMVALSKKHIYVVSEEGCWYSKPLGIFFTKQEAIKCWEKISCKKWKQINYEEYQNERKHVEGFWYYGLEEYSLDSLIQQEINYHLM